MVRIITDSAADFEPHELQRLGVTCIPLTVSFDGQEYQENVSLTKDRFYELLASTGCFPKSSQASPQMLLDLFGQAEQEGDEALYITLSSALSGTYQSAVMVRGMCGSQSCHVLDSLNATGGQRMVVEYAVRLRDAGLSAAQIMEKLEAMRHRVELYACIDTMEYLYLGGRISQAVYKLGSLARIKPIISIDGEGRVAVPAKAMGMRKGMDYLCKRLEALEPDPEFALYLMYTNNREVAEALAARLAEQGIAVPQEHIIQVGAAIGTHIGPEACGLVYVRR